MCAMQNAHAPAATTSERLFFLDLSGGRILSANPDGSDLKTIVSEGRKLPDGLAVDTAAGRLYWTNMGNPKKQPDPFSAQISTAKTWSPSFRQAARAHRSSSNSIGKTAGSTGVSEKACV